ncbi:dTDP-4-amino-4,6-dideoxygalactose transaminase [Azospirillum fermentarium]|uniref:DegT/DnrJ/EryC1/StrS family aminotransferase n=1 Tax=Azospirillum fermentarium TaxID=1233114 RepID=UPI002225DE19|nr:DegT/DnrJ/EryC1/StrS family aminotransferase [Azospirillum fermentarium]MCW2246933.1 dTDP-4-amino-4,6-dideoxygalactose transaminase [Azospirillum fermentarium]
MPDRPNPFRELPPTAGLPLGWKDLLGAAVTRTPPDFARDAARFLGVDDLLLTCSGTAALVVILTTLRRFSARRQVVVPAYTCPLVAIAVAHCGLDPVLCDLAPGSLDLDPAALRRLCGADTLAVVPTHLAGRVADVATAAAIARAAGAWVIEDAAQAFGARTAAGIVGTDGDFGLFSLAVGKGLTLFEGGLLHVREPALRAEMRRTAQTLLPAAPWREALRALQLAGYAAAYRPGLLPFAYGAGVRRSLRRGDPVAAAGDAFSRDIPLHRVGAWRQRVGRSAIRRLGTFLDAAAERAHRRVERLRAVTGLHVFGDGPGGRGVWPFLLVRMPDRAARDRALAVLWPAGLGVSRLFVHALPGYGFLRGLVPQEAVPNAASLADTTLTIGNSPWMSEQDFAAICGRLERAL